MGRAMKDVEFAVEDGGGHERIFKTFDEAAGFAISLAASDGHAHNIDVLVWSEAGANGSGATTPSSSTARTRRRASSSVSRSA